MKNIIHIVLFKIKEGTTKKQIEDFYENLYKIKNKIPGIISICGGDNISPEDFKKGYQEGFIMLFKDEKSRDNYIPHKEHKDLVKEYIELIIEDVLVYDLEC